MRSPHCSALPLALLTTWAVVSGGCANLPVVGSNTCGNGVQEQGEDCDLYVEAPQVCNAAGTVGQCRFACSQKDQEGPSCPLGWRCGADNICREPSGQFAEPRVSVAAGVQRVLLGDFDGDGHKDVFGTGSPSDAALALPRFFFLDNEGELLNSLTLGIAIGSPSVASLGTDRIDDVAFSTQYGLGVLIGKEDRHITSATYPLLTLPAGNRILLLRVLGYSGSPLKEGVLMFMGRFGETRISPVEQDEYMALLPWPVDGLLDGPVAADIVRGVSSPCEEVLLAFEGQSEVHLVEPCDEKGAWRDETTPRVVATLPSGATFNHSVRVADLDGDGKVDLLATTAGGAMYASFGCGESFCAFPGDTGVESLGKTVEVKHEIDTSCIDGAPPDARNVLALGDLDGDSLADVVAPSEVRLTKSVQVRQDTRTVVLRSCRAAVKLAGDWTIARLADLNHDGNRDVLAGSLSSLDVEYLIGTGKGRFNAAHIPTRGPVGHLISGDFDGDGLEDLAIGELKGEAIESKQDRLSLAFGKLYGIPDPPTEVARFSSIRQLASARYENSDAIEELGVVAQDDTDTTESISLLIGQTGRMPFTPFGLEIPSKDYSGIPVASVTGQFTSDNHPDVAALGILSTNGGSSSADLRARLWLIPSTGEARLSAETPSELLPAEIEYLIAPPGKTSLEVASFLLSGDWDQDGKDEVVLLASHPGNGGSVGVAWLARPERSGVGWQNSSTPLELLGESSLSLLKESNPVLADLDGDGLLDLVLVLASREGRRSVAVAWNQGGKLRLAEPQQLTVENEESHAFALFTADSDNIPDLAIATQSGLFVLRAKAKQRRDFKVEPLAELQGVDSVAGGDVTGDGVDDLVVAVGGAIRVFRGEPVLP